jgi:hypothetical protein
MDALAVLALRTMKGGQWEGIPSKRPLAGISRVLLAQRVACPPEL